VRTRAAAASYAARANAGSEPEIARRPSEKCAYRIFKDDGLIWGGPARRGEAREREKETERERERERERGRERKGEMYINRCGVNGSNLCE